MFIFLPGCWNITFSGPTSTSEAAPPLEALHGKWGEDLMTEQAFVPHLPLTTGGSKQALPLQCGNDNSVMVQSRGVSLVEFEEASPALNGR